jgi:hypothetical protein
VTCIGVLPPSDVKLSPVAYWLELVAEVPELTGEVDMALFFTRRGAGWALHGQA